MLLIIQRENIATPSRYIFVFGDEVLNKTIQVFPLLYTLYLHLTGYEPKYSLEKFPLLWLQKMRSTHRGRNVQKTRGRQMKSTIYIQQSVRVTLKS